MPLAKALGNDCTGAGSTHSCSDHLGSGFYIAATGIRPWKGDNDMTSEVILGTQCSLSSHYNILIRWHFQTIFGNINVIMTLTFDPSPSPLLTSQENDN